MSYYNGEPWKFLMRLLWHERTQSSQSHHTKCLGLARSSLRVDTVEQNEQARQLGDRAVTVVDKERGLLTRLTGSTLAADAEALDLTKCTGRTVTQWHASDRHMESCLANAVIAQQWDLN